MGKRILIVDDEESIAFFLAEGLTDLGVGYQVEKAHSGEEALELLSRQNFDLAITDLRMPGINGLELIEKARHRAPHTRFILITAYGSERAEAEAYRLGACRYMTKPFTMEKLAGAVQEALAEVKAPGRDMLALSDSRFDEIAECLTRLRFELGAQCILLADVTGQILAYLGDTDGIEPQVLIPLVSGGFATAFEMTRHLGEEQALTLNYHEGEHLDIYSANVNKELFVVLVFNRRHQRSKIGLVWLYTRRALKQLQRLVDSAERVAVSQVLDDDFGALVSSSLDEVFEEPTGSADGQVVRGGDGAARDVTLEAATRALGNDPSAVVRSR